MKIYKMNKDMSLKDITFVSRMKTGVIGILLIISIISTIAAIKPVEPPTKIVIRVQDTAYLEQPDISLNDSSILAELIRLKCILPSIALAQMKIETGNFKSAVCRENKNIAGIRTSKSKFVRGKNRGHCVYDSYRDCLKDYMNIHNMYLKKIDGKYAESPNYIETLKKFR